MGAASRTFPAQGPGDGTHPGRARWNGTPARARASTPVLFAVPSEPPHYHAMLAVDIQAFNDEQRGDDAQRILRTAMYALLERAFESSGLPLSACRCEDRGDGVLIIAPAGAPAATLVDPLAEYVRAGLRAHNKFCADLTRIHLRAAVHAGQVHVDGNGVFGRAVNHLFRCLDAAEFKHALAESGADFALVSSETFFEEVISPGSGLIDPEMYAPIDLQCKETRTRAWVYLPPVRNPFLRRVNRGRHKRTATAPNAEGGDPRRPARPTTVPPLSRPPIALRRTWPSRPWPPGPRRDPGDGAERSVRNTLSARARRIGAVAATTRGWLATVPETLDITLRERFSATAGVRHVDGGTVRRCVQRTARAAGPARAAPAFGTGSPARV